MLKSISRYFLIPVPEQDEDTARAVRMFKSFSRVIMAFLALLGIVTVFVFVKKTAVFMGLLALLMLLLISHLLALRGRIRLASALLLYGLWSVSTVQIWLSGGVNTVMVGSYFVIMAISGVLLGPRAVVAVAVLTVAASLGMTVLPTIGYPLPRYYPMPPWSAWFVLMFWCMLMVPTVNSAIRDYVDALGRTRREAEESTNAAEKLRKSEEMMKGILAASPVGIILTRDRHIKWVNDAWIGMFGFEDEREYLDKLTAMLHPSPEDYARVRSALYTNLKEGETREVATKLVRGDGSVFDAHIRIAPADPSDASKGTISAISDISARVAFEDALRQSERRYRSLFELSTEAILMVHPEGSILDVNPACSELLGASREELIGAHILQFYSNPSDREEFRRLLHRDQLVKGFRLRLRRKDGVERHCLLNSAAWKDEQGSTLAYVSSVRDVTEARDLERQLLQAQKMEAIGTLAGGIAHDFNNILTIVLGFSEISLADRNPDSEGYSELQAIRSAARRGADLVKQMLTFSRRAESNPRPLNLNRCVEDAHKLLSKTIPKMVDIELRLTDKLKIITADPVQIEQILLNLALNANDAMPDGGKLVFTTDNVVLDDEYVRLNPEVSPGEYVMLVVQDSGRGMPPEIVERIFEPFFSTKKPGEGTGLGLAMVYGIVKAHNGEIKCYSETGVGTSFKICLPATTPPEIPEADKTVSLPSCGSETILLVDDEELVRELANRILTRSGYRVLTAGNGREAVNIYEKEKAGISLVILDLIMPEMGGKECLLQLLKVNPNVKVIIASGLAGDGPTRETIEGGARAYVGKPFDMQHLLGTVRKVLDETYS